MKKVLIFLGVLMLVFIAAIYISVSSTNKESSTCVLADKGQLGQLNFSKHDSVRVRASLLFKGNELKNFMQGEQYRKAWLAEVTVPIVFLDTLKKGLKIIEEGGGRQTESLELEDKEGIRYTLRSINKNAEKLIPEFARTLGIENIVVDGISAQHPYAAPVVARLSETIRISHTHPKVYFVPKQEVLGRFNDDYGNRLFLFEYETESETNWTSFENIVDIVDTDDLQELKMKDFENVAVDKKMLIRSRLFDIVIGDWDRHAKQWGWALQKESERLLAIPVPSDRDNAFFNVEGLIPSIIADEEFFPGMQPFEKDIDYMPGLIMPFDRYFLLNTPKDFYLNQAQSIISSMTDSAIEEAFDIWEPSIYNLDAKEIIEKIKYRRDHLSSYAERFYELVQSKGPLKEPLKGSEDLTLSQQLLSCFDCGL